MGKRDPDEQALKDFLHEEERRQKKEEEGRKKRKEAARVWFNTMEELWPPEDTPEYWMKACEKCRSVYNEAKDNPLLQSLMLALYDFLGDEVKREDKDDG